jgi:hypothetical protein
VIWAIWADIASPLPVSIMMSTGPAPSAHGHRVVMMHTDACKMVHRQCKHLSGNYLTFQLSYLDTALTRICILGIVHLAWHERHEPPSTCMLDSSIWAQGL